jgi:hypothetical protein
MFGVSNGAMENIFYGAHHICYGVSFNNQRCAKPTIHLDRLMKLPDLQGYPQKSCKNSLCLYKQLQKLDALRRIFFFLYKQ